MSSNVMVETVELFDENDGFGADTLAIQITPLETVLGIKNAEQVYDLLCLRDQLIIDLRAAGWSQHDIADALGISQGWVSILVQRIRYTLANSNLVRTMEIRQHLRDTSPIMRGGSEHFEEGIG